MSELHPIARVKHIVDVHAHVGPYFFHMGADDAGENARMCEHFGITRQIVSHARGVFHDPVAGNEQLARDLESHDELLGYVVINQRNLDMAERELNRWLQPGSPFVGVKIHTHYPDTTMDSPQLRDTFQMLDAYGTILLIHTWGTDVIDLGAAVEGLGDIRVIAGHMGADRWDLAAEVAREVPHLYLEPSCSVTHAGQMRHVLDNAPRGQILFGTDATLLDPTVALGQVAAADMSPDELDDVMWRNALALFGESLRLDTGAP